MSIITKFHYFGQENLIRVLLLFGLLRNHEVTLPFELAPQLSIIFNNIPIQNVMFEITDFDIMPV